MNHFNQHDLIPMYILFSPYLYKHTHHRENNLYTAVNTKLKEQTCEAEPAATLFCSCYCLTLQKSQTKTYTNSSRSTLLDIIRSFFVEVTFIFKCLFAAVRPESGQNCCGNKSGSLRQLNIILNTNLH